MRFRIGTFALGLLLVLSTACNKPNTNQPQSDNSAQPAQPADNNAPQSTADNSQPAAQPRAPEILTVPAGKALNITRADAVGSKISQPGQTSGGALAKPVEV